MDYMQLNTNKLEKDATKEVKQLFYSPKEVAIIFGINLSTVYKKVKQGIFPEPVNIGGTISRFHREDIEDLIYKMKNGELAVRKS